MGKRTEAPEGPKVELRQVDGLVPYARNARTHSEVQVAQLAAMIEEFGWTNPVLADAKGIVAGHGRVLAASLLYSRGRTIRLPGGRTLPVGTVPVIDCGGWSDGQRRAYVIADNQSALKAGWDEKLLALEFKDLKEIGFDMALVGFDPTEIKIIEARAAVEPGKTDPDEVPEPPAIPVSRTGDLWILGTHRILCGDSTKAEDVARLMGSERAGIMNTDPPYGVSYDSAALHMNNTKYVPIENDGLADAKLQEFLEACFRAATGVALQKNAAWYLWHAHLTQGYFAAAAAAAAANVVLHRQIIWVKSQLIFGRGQYHWKHEPCFMGWVKGHQPPDFGKGNGERTQTTVWDIAGVNHADRKEFNHSTPKPVELFTIPMVKHLNAGEIAYEPFSGSGPQIIAGEQTGRRVFAMELAPQFVDVAVKRWEKFSGKAATLDGTGQTFAQVASGSRNAERNAPLAKPAPPRARRPKKPPKDAPPVPASP